MLLSDGGDMNERGSGSRPLRDDTTGNSRSRQYIGPLEETGPDVEKIITDIVMSYVSPSVRFLDIACRNGIHLEPLCSRIIHGLLIGIDPLREHVFTARRAVATCDRASIVRSSVFKLPFRGHSFNIITCRMSSVSIREAYRVLDTNGWFIHKGPGPEYNIEIKDAFKDRYVFKPYDTFAEQDWKTVCADNARKLGFDYFHIDEYLCYAYYDEQGLTEYLEMVPVVDKFDREKDSVFINKIIQTCKTDKGIRISRQLYLIRARK
jgi:SAM-dependent methyltransferase